MKLSEIKLGPRVAAVIGMVIIAVVLIALFAPEQFDHVLEMFGDEQ